MLDDFEARAQRAGYGMHAGYNFRYRVEKFWDNREQARAYFQKMSELPLDDLSNCSACLRNELVSYAIYVEQYERAAELAAPLLDGEEKCATVPHRERWQLLGASRRLSTRSTAC